MHCISFVPLVLIIFSCYYLAYICQLFVHALLTPIAWGRMNVLTNRDWIVFAERREINVSAAQSGSFTTSASGDHSNGHKVQ